MKYRVDATVRVSYETDGASPDEAKAAAWLMVASGHARLVDMPSASAVEVTPEQQLAAQNLRFWLENEAVQRQGGRAEADRLVRGELGDEAMCALARREMFAGWHEIKRWHPMPYADVRHADTCGRGAGEHVTARTLPHKFYKPRELRESERDVLAKILEIAHVTSRHPWLEKTGESVALEVRWHVLSCDRCAATVAKPSVMVTIPWGERMLSREYAL